MKAKIYYLKRNNNGQTEKKKFHENSNFDFLTACHEIKFDELQIL